MVAAPNNDRALRKRAATSGSGPQEKAPVTPRTIDESLSARTAAVEARVRQSYSATLEPKFPSALTLIAVGGFGRGELFPHSDVDLLILIESDTQVPAVKETLSLFLQSLWDSGLRPSHSVHTVAECVIEHEQNAELTISLLDRRILSGDPTLFDSLDQKFRAFIQKRGEAVARQLATLAVGRRAKYQNTIYHLEPNVKDTPGGLRDLQTVRWLATLHPRDVVRGLDDAFHFLSALRIRLHQAAGRDQNVLTFDLQEGFDESPAELMRDYYRQARLVDRAARHAIEMVSEQPGSLLGRFHEWRSRLSTPEFSVVRDQVLLRSSNILPADLSLFQFVARHQLRLAPDTVDRLKGFVPKANWSDWKKLLALPHASYGLRAMQECGALPAVLPEWRNIECLVVRDFYHRYTVDEHTLVALDLLESIKDGRFAGLFEEIQDQKELLCFALLVHDIGKGSGHEHVAESLRIAKIVLERLGAPAADCAAIEFLVTKHLALSSVMTSRDLSDASTARLLSNQVETIERLKLLTMLTYADISAVNPQAMTPWRLEQLWRVYLLAHEELTRELGTARIHAEPGADPERAQFLEGLPTRYLRTHSPAEIDGHLALARRLESAPLAIEIEHEQSTYRLTLLTRDRPALFAPVAGAISSFGLNILKAEAFSNADGVVVDTFMFSDPHRTLELNPPEVDRLRGIVRKVVEGKQDATKLLRGRPKPLLPSRTRLKPRVAFNNEASETATLIEIVAEDRPGLLYDLARAMSEQGCNIEVVLINTEAHKALDVFYVSKIGRDVQDRLKTALVAACTSS
jgi:[protein-PII] uridylyltransferase